MTKGPCLFFYKKVMKICAFFLFVLYLQKIAGLEPVSTYSDKYEAFYPLYSSDSLFVVHSRIRFF